jgi:hypothetical protein
MARVRNLHRVDLYCPEYMTNATILIDQNHHSGQPHLVAHYEMGGLKAKCNLPRLFLPIGAMMIWPS